MSGVSYRTPGGKILLDSVDWNIGKGEHWVLLGPNGSGKTLLLEVLLGYLAPSTGTVRRTPGRVSGDDLRECRRALGYVSTYLKDMFSPRERVRDVVASGRFASVGLYEDVTPDLAEKSSALLRAVGLGDRGGDRLGVLSDGEKQKALLARALAGDPELLVLDEPASSLDYASREDLLDTLVRISSSGAMSTVYVTHRIEEIPPVSRRILMLSSGKLFFSGNLAEGLTEERLGKLFGRPLALHREGSRYFVVPGTGR